MPKNRMSRKDWQAHYEGYLNSLAWQRKRNEYKAARPWVCSGCKSKKRLQLHHLTYERLGSERLDDLIPLCAKCHYLAHRLVRSGQATIANVPTLLYRKDSTPAVRKPKEGQQRKRKKEKSIVPGGGSAPLPLPQRSLADRMAGNTKIKFDPDKRKKINDAERAREIAKREKKKNRGLSKFPGQHLLPRLRKP